MHKCPSWHTHFIFGGEIFAWSPLASNLGIWWDQNYVIAYTENPANLL